MNIAIDGPAGAGKSTIAKMLAKELKFVYLDTGAMYRTIGLKAHNSALTTFDTAAIQKMLDNTVIEICYDDGVQRIFCDGKDVSAAIREHYVSKLASDFSALVCVRLKMVDLQRQLALKANTILDGRDIGTFVLPNAEFKFFVTASIQERASRRYKELTLKGERCDLEVLQEDIRQRDYNDEHRDFAPLKRAEDAILIDTTFMSIEQVVEKLIKIIHGAVKK